MTSPVNPVPSSPAGVPTGVPAAPFPAPAAGMGMPAPEPKRSWFARHKILTGIGAFIAVGMIASALNGGGGSGNSSTTTATLPSIQSMASAPAQATAGQDSAAAPIPQQQEAAKDAEKSDSALSFPGKQSGDVVGNAGDTIDDDGIKVSATPVAAVMPPWAPPPARPSRSPTAPRTRWTSMPWTSPCRTRPGDQQQRLHGVEQPPVGLQADRGRLGQRRCLLRCRRVGRRAVRAPLQAHALAVRAPPGLDQQPLTSHGVRRCIWHCGPQRSGTTFHAAGCVSFRQGAFDAVGDSIPVPAHARRPPPEENVPSHLGPRLSSDAARR